MEGRRHFFRFLRSKRALHSNFKGKKTSFVFFLDKDVDEFRKIQIRSKYFFYTEYYDLQNYLFMHGDFINAAAASASVTVDSMSHTIGDKTTWLTHCIMTWKDWVTICLFVSKCNISLGGYALSSKINLKEFGPIDQQKLDTYKALAFRKSGLDKGRFDALYSEVETEVNNFYATGYANKIFKGKWYLHWLKSHIKTEHRIEVNHKNLACILVSNLDWQGEWNKSYRFKLNRLVKAHTES